MDVLKINDDDDDDGCVCDVPKGFPSETVRTKYSERIQWLGSLPKYDVDMSVKWEGICQCDA